MKPSVRTCFLTGFSVVVGLFAVATTVTVSSIGRIGTLEGRLHRIDAARHHGHMALSAIQEQYIHQAHSLIVGDRSHLDHYREFRAAAVSRLHCLEQACEAIGRAERVIPIRSTTDAMHRHFEEEVLPRLGALAPADLRRHHQRLETLTDDARKLTEELNRVLDAAGAETRTELAELLVTTRLATFAILSVAVVAAAAIGWILLHLIGRPLLGLHGALVRFGSGQLGTRLVPAGPRELEELARRFNDMAAAIEEAQAKIAHNERLAAMGQIAAGVAHEINNPLAVITGYLPIVRRAVADPTAAEDLAIIADEVAQCRRIVQSLLDLARPQALRLEALDLAELVRETVSRVDRVQLDGAAVTVDLPSDPLPWTADASALRRVLTNLLTNAGEAAGSGGRVVVALHAGDGRAVLEVRDSGPGVAAGDEARIFQPFCTTKAKGLGLGLAICEVLVRGHGGQIAVDRGPEGGARFRVVLPRRPPPPSGGPS